MVDYLGLIIDCDNFTLKGLTLEMLTERYGSLDNCTRDIATIEKEIVELLDLKEEYIKIKKDIQERINLLSNLETKNILKINEHIKENQYDYYSLQVRILNISTDNKIIINNIDDRDFKFSERGKTFEKYLDEVVEKYPDIEIYSNKQLKKYKYKDLEILNDLI